MLGRDRLHDAQLHQLGVEALDGSIRGEVLPLTFLATRLGPAPALLLLLLLLTVALASFLSLGPLPLLGGSSLGGSLRLHHLPKVLQQQPHLLVNLPADLLEHHRFELLLHHGRYEPLLEVATLQSGVVNLGPRSVERVDRVANRVDKLSRALGLGLIIPLALLLGRLLLLLLLLSLLLLLGVSLGLGSLGVEVGVVVLLGGRVQNISAAAVADVGEIGKRASLRVPVLEEPRVDLILHLLAHLLPVPFLDPVLQVFVRGEVLVLVGVLSLFAHLVVGHVPQDGVVARVLRPRRGSHTQKHQFLVHQPLVLPTRQPPARVLLYDGRDLVLGLCRRQDVDPLLQVAPVLLRDALVLDSLSLSLLL